MDAPAQQVGTESLATIFGDVKLGGKDINPFRIVRIATHLPIPVRGSDLRIEKLPAPSSVIGTINAAAIPLGNGIDGVRLTSAYRQTNTPSISSGESVAKPVPCPTTVNRAEHAAFRTCGQPTPITTLTLPRTGVEQIWIVRVDHHLDDPCPRTG